MAEARESSGLLSLAALRSDAERSQKQAELARAQAEMGQRARLAAERERAHAQREQEERERALQRAVEMARRAEMAELERARATELERGEREAQSRRDLERSLTEERLTWRRTELQLSARNARARLFNWISTALSVTTWLGTTALYVGMVRPDAERSSAALQRALGEEDQVRRDAALALDRAKQREVALRERVTSLEQALQAAHAQSEALPSHAPEKHERYPSRPSLGTRAPCRDDGDPLNPCLKP